jgi:hypothetical protein
MTNEERTPAPQPLQDEDSDVSAAKTDTAVSDNEPVTESNPGGAIGDTTGEDRLGADDTRDRER